MPEISRLLVIAPNWLGDAVMALPALADVKRHFPRASIAVAARASIAPLYSLVPGVDQVLTLRSRGIVRDRAERRGDVERLASAGADVAVLFPNSFASAWMVKAAGIAERWGYAADWRGRLLTRPVRRPRQSLHQAAYYQALIRGLGMSTGPLEPAIEVATSDVEAARALLTARGWDGTRPLLVVAPGAAYGTAKRWLPHHFARLIQSVVRTHGVVCVLVGSAGDAETTRWIVDAVDTRLRGSVIDVAGATSLEMLVAILGLAAVCVSNDSGAMHLAGAVGVPLAALFGPTREYETSPLTRAGGRSAVVVNPVWCRPCMLRECPIDHRCMKGLTPERVATVVAGLMGEERCEGVPGDGEERRQGVPGDRAR
jgi:heptosyltransferase II